GIPGGPMVLGLEPDSAMTFVMVLHGLGLTADQHTRVRTIMERHRARLQDLFAQMRTAHEAFASRLLAPGSLTIDDLAPPIQQVTQLRAQVMTEGATLALELRGVLTADQLAKAQSISRRLQDLHGEIRKLLGGDGGSGDDGA